MKLIIFYPFLIAYIWKIEDLNRGEALEWYTMKKHWAHATIKYDRKADDV